MTEHQRCSIAPGYHPPTFVGTTILAVRRGGQVVVAGDGQVTLGERVVKASARKVRRLHDDKVIAGFAGSTADAFTLFERFEARLKDYSGNLRRAAVELAKDWRTDRALRRLEAMLIVVDAEVGFMVSGTGDVIEPEDGVMAIGSGSGYALAAARALLGHTQLGAAEITRASLGIAADLCIYTNRELVLEQLG